MDLNEVKWDFLSFFNLVWLMIDLLFDLLYSYEDDIWFAIDYIFMMDDLMFDDSLTKRLFLAIATFWRVDPQNGRVSKFAASVFS